MWCNFVVLYFFSSFYNNWSFSMFNVGLVCFFYVVVKYMSTGRCFAIDQVVGRGVCVGMLARSRVYSSRIWICRGWFVMFDGGDFGLRFVWGFIMAIGLSRMVFSDAYTLSFLRSFNIFLRVLTVYGD